MSDCYGKVFGAVVRQAVHSFGTPCSNNTFPCCNRCASLGIRNGRLACSKISSGARLPCECKQVQCQLSASHFVKLQAQATRKGDFQLGIASWCRIPGCSLDLHSCKLCDTCTQQRCVCDAVRPHGGAYLGLHVEFHGRCTNKDRYMRLHHWLMFSLIQHHGDEQRLSRRILPKLCEHVSVRVLWQN